MLVYCVHGIEQVVVAVADLVVEGGVVHENTLELVVASSVHFSESEELMVDVVLVLGSDLIVGLTLPEDMLRGGSATLALWVFALISGGKLGGMESMRRSYASSNDSVLSPFSLGVSLYGLHSL